MNEKISRIDINNVNYKLKDEDTRALGEMGKQALIKVGYYVCSTQGSTAAKTISAADYTLSTGGCIRVKMENANTANNATLNINSTGAKPLYYSGVMASSTNSWQAGETVDIYYDGTNYYANNVEGVSRQVLNEINAKIDALSSGVGVSLAISPSTIYKGSDQSVTLTGTMTNGTPTSMKLMDGNTQLKAATTSPITHQITINILTNTKSYQVVGETLGLTLNDSASLNARYPIYYGFGSNASSVATNANRYSATTSAAHTYEKTSSTNGQSFYILIPTDITDVSNFVMNGAPFVMDAVSTQTINGVSYKVHKSSNTYNSGTTIKVTAS